MEHKKMRKHGEGQSAWLANEADAERRTEEAYWADDEEAENSIAETSTFSELAVVETSLDDTSMTGTTPRKDHAKSDSRVEQSSRFNPSEQSITARSELAPPMVPSRTSSYVTMPWWFTESPFPIREFYLFPELPLGLRLKIWEYCAPPPFFLNRLECRHRYRGNNFDFYMRHPPAVLHACTESRNVFKWNPRKHMERRREDQKSRNNKKEPGLQHPLYCLLSQFTTLPKDRFIWVSVEYDVLVIHFSGQLRNENLALMQNVVVPSRSLIGEYWGGLAKLQNLRKIYIEKRYRIDMSPYYDPTGNVMPADVMDSKILADVKREVPDWKVPALERIYVVSGGMTESEFELSPERGPRLFKAAVANGLRVGWI